MQKKPQHPLIDVFLKHTFTHEYSMWMHACPLHSVVCVQVYEAYGQTECTAGCTFTTPGDWTPGEPEFMQQTGKRSLSLPGSRCLFAQPQARFKGLKVVFDSHTETALDMKSLSINCEKKLCYHCCCCCSAWTRLTSKLCQWGGRTSYQPDVWLTDCHQKNKQYVRVVYSRGGWDRWREREAAGPH